MNANFTKMDIKTRQEKKAVELVAQAEKKLKSFNFFGLAGSKHEDAMEMYKQAASQFHIAQNWEKSTECYMLAAELAEKTDNKLDVLECHMKAAKVYKNYSISDAIKMFHVAVELQLSNGRISSAAKLYTEIGELEEKQSDYKAAINAFNEAANCYEMEEQTAHTNKSRVKVANLCIKSEEYKRAVELLEAVSNKAKDNNLGKWSVKDYLYKAMLCHLAMGSQSGDMSQAKDKFERYCDLLATFETSREAKFIVSCIASFEEQNVDSFTEVTENFDRIYPIEHDAMKMLLKVKKAIENGSAAPGGELGVDEEPDFC